jgi:hypothetical protein
MQAPSAGVPDGPHWSARHFGALGTALAACSVGPCARATPGCVVLKLKAAKRPRAPAAHLMGGRPGLACTQRGCAASPPAWRTARPASVSALLGISALVLAFNTPSILLYAVRMEAWRSGIS